MFLFLNEKHVFGVYKGFYYYFNVNINKHKIWNNGQNCEKKQQQKTTEGFEIVGIFTRISFN
jgi:hypothetical protein